MNTGRVTWDNLMSIISDIGGKNITEQVMRPSVIIKSHDTRYGKRPRLQKIEKGDWIDLYTAEDTYLYVNEFALIPLGISVKLPDGYEAIIAPRSSTFIKYNVLMTNSIGIIDNTYCGENDIWRFPAYAVTETKIPKDTRIAQFRIFRNQPNLELVETDLLEVTDRGGFGSTGN